MKVDGITKRHRGFSHSLIGISTSSLMVFIYLIIILITYELYSSNLGIENVLFFSLLAMIGFCYGSIFHLIGDSFTVMGVMWLYPKKEKMNISGNIKTFEKSSDEVSEWFLFGAVIPILFSLVPDATPFGNHVLGLLIIIFMIILELPVLFVVSLKKFKKEK